MYFFITCKFLFGTFAYFVLSLQENSTIMAFNTFWKSNTAFVLKMFALAAVVILVIYFAIFVWLDSYTQHGIEVEVPDVCGMYTSEAEVMLAEQQLHIQVIDSTYSKKVPYGSIVEQNPRAGAKAKHGRSIYVIVNAKMQRLVPIPELKDMSHRQAQAALQSLGFVVDTVLYEPSEFRGLVLDVRQNGVSVSAGSRLPEGMKLQLIIGQGNGTEQIPVPNLIGKTLDEARTLLLESRLVIGALNYAEPQVDHVDETYYIYQQEPAEGAMILEGSRIDLSLSIDATKQATVQEEEEEDDFF